MTKGLCAWRASGGLRLTSSLAFLLLLALPQQAALAQSKPLAPPQAVAGVTFAIRSAILKITEVAPYGARPTARFSIAMTNTGKSSIGFVVEPGPSGASTDTGFDLKGFSASVARGFKTCANCKDVPEDDWVVLQPNQTNNAVIGFWSNETKAVQKHRHAESADLTLVFLIKEPGQGMTRAVLSFSDIPIQNELE